MRHSSESRRSSRTPRRALAPVAALALSAGLALAGAPRAAAAQGVLVAPQAVFMDHRTRTGSVELYNPGTSAAEVTLSTLFGYPVTDSAGVIHLRTVESPDSTMPSAAAWVQPYPRRLTLRPGERQTVRLLARPPATLADGEYWTRLVVAATSAGAPLLASADSAALNVGLTLEVRTVIALLYRKGPQSTGVALSALRGAVVGDSIELRARLARQGSAAYLGTVRAAVIDAAGAEAATYDLPVAVYREMEPRFRIAAATSLRPGRYLVRFQVAADRDEIARQWRLPSAVVRDSVVVTVPPRGR